MAETTLGAIVDQVEYEVERGKIGEFSRATRTESAVHRDPEAAAAAGFERIPATLTHSVVAGHYRDQAGFVAKLGLALSRIVVGSVKWTYLRPLAAGDALRGIRRVVGDEPREGKRGGTMRVVTLETDYRDAAGDRVLTVREVLIERGTDACDPR
ncbi:FAS1-like dehydratase domain-containing protein [Nocardia sp. R6R-6]|uniref:FAS1-like dehydratase domain-containing protein n=1 Tax=Nocardia sp. R6R-6 TaxID=3459303 RepID=UPI00403DBD1A